MVRSRGLGRVKPWGTGEAWSHRCEHVTLPQWSVPRTLSPTLLRGSQVTGDGGNPWSLTTGDRPPPHVGPETHNVSGRCRHWNLVHPGNSSSARGPGTQRGRRCPDYVSLEGPGEMTVGRTGRGRGKRHYGLKQHDPPNDPLPCVRVYRPEFPGTQ